MFENKPKICKKSCTLIYEGRVNMYKDHVNIYTEYSNNSISLMGFGRLINHHTVFTRGTTSHLALHILSSFTLKSILEFCLQVSPSDTSNFEDSPGPPMESYPMLTEEEEAMFQDL